MEEKKNKINKQKSDIPSAESFSSPDIAGYLFKLIHEGWLRKRWRKRYCVLSNGILYFYEFKTSDGTEKTCSSLNLKTFEECTKAPRKECKKSPNTFILEPTKSPLNDAKRTKQHVQREFLYTETPEEQEKWVAKLQEALSLTGIGGTVKLTHITKTRARPPGGGNRRPPTKQHIKERAMMAEVSLDVGPTEIQENGGSKKRGHLPTTAIKPPPNKARTSLKPTNLALKPKIEETENPDEDVEDKSTKDSPTDSLSPAPITPKTPTPPPAALKPQSTKKRINASEDSPTDSLPPPPLTPPKTPLTPKSPSPPPSALKPPSTKRVITVRTDSTGSADSRSSLPSAAPLHVMVIAELESKSLPSSRTSSIGQSDRVGSFKKPSDSSQTSTPVLISSPEHPVSTPTSENEEDVDKPVSQIQEINGDQLRVREKVKLDDRMMKAKSMMELDRDSDPDDDLPPPPPPPPYEPNGDVKKGTDKKDKKKKKKKEKKCRPSSLVLDI